jgi:hypothetical protein
MTKLKKGDEVICVSNGDDSYALSVGAKYIVEWVGDSALQVTGDNSHVAKYNYPMRFFATPIDEAKNLLEKAGYTITPPKPKLTGKVVVWSFDENPSKGSPFVSSLENYVDGEDKIIFATVDWTEGDGLTKE